MHPLVTRPDGPTLILPPRLLPPASYYRVAASFPRAVVDWSGRFDRTVKSTHRFEIADTRGRLMLTVPIAKPCQGATWADVTLSDHGRWQETLPTALESAYGRTPFYEFYADRFIPLISAAGSAMRLIDFASALDAQVRDILTLPDDTLVHTATPPSDGVRLSVSCDDAVGPYWQVRQSRFGFLPGLSILDLIFNLGPEAALALR
ncbi:MAG: WbqC family protein [Paramuribaculum sp.]|nr:WbqC family protein [Paramuribaculum sp.]